MGWRAGIDSGGTFIDLQAVSEAGQTLVIKVPSTPAEPALGVIHALAALIERSGGQPSDIELVAHGTTVAVNAILQGRFPEIGLVVTEGFRHILELGRQTVPGERGAIYTWVKPPRIVHLRNVREVRERLDARGRVLAEFDAESCRQAARWYRERDIPAVAICFMNSYASGAHERLARDVFAQEYPECLVTLSCETLPEFREYERAVTTCMNALLMPLLGRYVKDLQSRLHELEVQAPLFIMKSAGGATRADLAVNQPVYTALSGPAAAVAGLAWLGRAAGFANLITFDMGGTSTDVCLVEDGEPSMASETQIGDYPIRAAAVDVVSVGAGGGSIGWLAPGGRLSVGPRSAGADPGPACYGRGGEAATMTDANLLLGRLPEALAGGTIRLDRGSAEQALARFGASLGLSAQDAARGIVQICELNMADAVRQVTIRKGRDPRLFGLMAAGGAGPLHAVALAEQLGIPTVVVPPSPGVGCALGALVSNVREDYVATGIQRLAELDLARLNEEFAALEAKASEALARQGFGPERRRIVRAADLRYRGMRTELTVGVDGGTLSASAAAEMERRFHGAHQENYGYSYEGQQQVELVNLRLSGIGLLPEVAPPAARRNGRNLRPEPVARRPVYFEAAGFVETPIFEREGLYEGARLGGPAIVQQYDSTTVIPPAWSARVDRAGNLVLSRSGV